MKREIIGRVNHSNPNQKVLILDERAFRAMLLDFKDQGKVRITIQTLYKTRSNPQNSVFHWYCDLIADEVGMEPEDVKIMMKKKFYMVPMVDVNGNEVVDPETGEIFLVPGSTAKMDTMQMFDFTEKIRLWSDEFLGTSLPLPDANYKIHFLENQKEKTQNGKND